jgi:N-acyl homoserine lactone hydrolase
VALGSAPYGPFPQSYRLTEAGDVLLVPLPGHTPGHLGVIVGPDEAAQRITQERIRAYAAANPTVYLAAHDPDTGSRLAERRVIQPGAAEPAA